MSSCLSPAIEQADSHFLHYITQKFKCLSLHEYHVFLLIDEIHLKPYFDYVGGKIVAAAFASQQAATTSCCFIISSVFSSFKDVVHVMPCQNLESNTLFNMIKRVVLGLEEIDTYNNSLAQSY